MAKNPYHVIGLKALLSMPEPPMLIDSILPRQGITGLASKPGLGKTFLCLEMARAVVTGGMCLGQFKAKVGAVLFIGQDQSILEYARQLRKTILTEYEQQKLDYPDEVNDFEDRLFFIAPAAAGDRRVWVDDREDTDDIITAANNITHSDSGEPYVEYIYDPVSGGFTQVPFDSSTRGVALIVVDTLSASHGSDENSNTEMNEIFRNVRKIAEQTRAAVVLTHHLTKSTGEFRGAGAQEGALDNLIELHGKPGDTTIKFVVKKFRGIRHPDFEYQMEVDEKSAKLTYGLKPGGPNEIQSRVLEFLRDAKEPQTLGTIVMSLQQFYPTMDPKELYSKVNYAMTMLKKPSNKLVHSPEHGKWTLIKGENDA